jgi:predicted metal-dependent peptidase
MFNQTLTPQQRSDKNVIKIMGHERYRALAGVLMIGKRLVVDDIPNWPYPHLPQTAMTNGKDEWYSTGYIESLTDPQLRGLNIHECGHKMFRHLTTWQGLYKKDPECANKSCDYFLNLRIVDDNKVDGFAELPPGGLVDERFRGMNSLQIFDILYVEKKKRGGGGGSDDGEGTGIDAHDWEGAKDLTDEEKHELEREIDEAIRQGALVAGKSGTGGNRDIDELMETQVDWREELRKFVTSTCAGNDYSTWSQPSRRYIAGGIYMPRGVSESVEELCVELDMSGSTMRMVKYFLTELVSVCKMVRPQTVRVIYWDTRVAKEQVFKIEDIDNILTLIKPAGSGGTTVQCVPDYCNEFNIKPQAHIVLTDGYLGGDWGRGWNAPVLWCICDNKTARPDQGTIVHINSSKR